MVVSRMNKMQATNAALLHLAVAALLSEKASRSFREVTENLNDD